VSKITYRKHQFQEQQAEMVAVVDKLLWKYAAEGYDLTLRQAYYALVAQTIIPNTKEEYKKLGALINNARLAGLIDWDLIVDRTRNVRSLSHWTKPGNIILTAAQSFRMDRWKDQNHYVECWIEKDALVGVISGVCERYDVPYFSCRGYTSQSACWRAAMRIQDKLDEGKECLVLHLSDHDPSGIDMTRDIGARLEMFGVGECEVRRIALTMKQIKQYDPPPNPAKTTDARARFYIAVYGDESWELDALEPKVIESLIEENLKEMIDKRRWKRVEREEQRNKRLLNKCAGRWSNVVGYLKKLKDGREK